MRRRESLAGQVVAINVLLVVATLFAASAAASLDLEVTDERARFGLLAITIVLALLVNMAMLRRRFGPLERLIERVEAIDPADPQAFDPPPEARSVEEIDRLATSFCKLLDRIEVERRRSGRLVLRAQEEERKRVARDLHDEVNQSLTGLLLRLEALRDQAPYELEREIDDTKALANQAMQELLTLARQLRPTALDDLGLKAALAGNVSELDRRSPLDVSFTSDASTYSDLSADAQLVVYRVAQEALSNAAQHAEAQTVKVDLFRKDGFVELTIEDDGRGFTFDQASRGLGMGGMRERALLVGGDLRIESRPGVGTRVRLLVPIENVDGSVPPTQPPAIASGFGRAARG